MYTQVAWRCHMATFVILSRISPGAFDDPKDFKDMAKTVSEKIKWQCPGVTWKDSYATLGRFDIVDIVEAADPKEVERSEEHTSELQSPCNLVCRLLLEKKKKKNQSISCHA